MEKLVFKPWEIKCHLKHIFHLCVCDVYIESQWSRFQCWRKQPERTGVTATVKIEGWSKTHKAWMLRPGGKKCQTLLLKTYLFSVWGIFSKQWCSNRLSENKTKQKSKTKPKQPLREFLHPLTGQIFCQLLLNIYRNMHRKNMPISVVIPTLLHERDIVGFFYSRMYFYYMRANYIFLLQMLLISLFLQ